jgi:DNA polymerase-1
MTRLHSNKFPVFDESLPVEVDIETNGLNPFRIDARIWCMALSQDPQDVYWLRVRQQDMGWYQDFFSRFKIIARRGTFEGTWIATYFRVQPKLYFDTKVGAFLIDENEETGLKAEAVRILRVPNWDDIESFTSIRDWNQLKRYNGRDVMYDLRIYRERHLPFLQQTPKVARLAKYIIIPAIEIFTKVICDGFHINESLARERLQICNEKLKEYNGQINEIAGRYVNPASPKQMNKLFYEDLKLRCPIKTKKGNKSTSEAALIRLMGKHSIVDHTLEWRKWKKYESTYLVPWINRGPILHANYGFTDTDTGRLNSTMVKNKRREKKLGATLHQCPRDAFIRNLITARDDDSCIVAADLSQIELRLVADRANERTMIGIFNRGEDIHYATAATLTTKNIDKEMRKKAKAVNFGFVYGMWAKKFIAYAKEKFGLNLTSDEGESYREAFFDKYEDLIPWHNHVGAFVSRTGYIDSIFGRRRHLPSARYGSGVEEWLRREYIRQAINSPIQSGGSDLNLFIAVLISSRTIPWRFKINPSKAFMVGSAHDSQIYECKRDYVKELKEGFKYTMEHLHEATDRYFKFVFKVPILMDVVAYESCWEGEELHES